MSLFQKQTFIPGSPASQELAEIMQDNTRAWYIEGQPYRVHDYVIKPERIEVVFKASFEHKK